MKLLHVGGAARRGWVSLLLLAVLGESPAFAQDGADEEVTTETAGERKRVLVGKFSGAKTESARDWVVEAFQSDGGYELVPDPQALELAANASPSEIVEAAGAAKVDVVVLGESVFKGKAGWVAKLRVYDGPTGELIEEVPVSTKTFELYETSLKAGEGFLPVAAKAQGWPREQPEEEVAPEPTPATEAPAVAPTRRGNAEWHSPLRFLIGSRLVNRSFRYTDLLSDRPTEPTAREPVDYPRFTLPMPRAEVRWYPAGHFTEGWASQLGIVGGYEIAVGARLSYDGNGDGVAETPVTESHDFWYVGARGRIPIGDIALGLQIDYGVHRLALSGAQDQLGLPIFPDVAYSQVEIGADFEWRIEQLIVGLHGSYNILLGLGAIGEDVNPDPNEPTPWFPGSQGTAVDFGAYVGWRLSRVFDILVGLDMRAYGLDFGAVPPTVSAEERVIAGGATDRFMSAWLALAVKLPAKGTAPVAEADSGSGTPTTEEDDDLDFSAFE